MTIPDYLRTANGDIFSILPDGAGEVDVNAEAYPSPWTDVVHTIVTGQAPTYRTLKDTSGNTWYLYCVTVGIKEGEISVSDAIPTQTAGVWNEPVYEEVIPDEGTTIHYLTLQDSDGTDWYIYPNAFGEPIITDVEPG